MEDELFALADGVVVTAESLQSKHRGSSPLLYLPHGVDFDHFHHGTGQPRSIPVLDGIAARSSVSLD